MKQAHPVFHALGMLVVLTSCGSSPLDEESKNRVDADSNSPSAWTASRAALPNAKPAPLETASFALTGEAHANRHAVSGAESAIHFEDGRLSVHAQTSPLHAILEKISEQSGIVIVQAAGLDDELISTRLEAVLLEDGLRELLKNQDLFFFFAEGTSKGLTPSLSLKKVWVYPKGKGEQVMPVAAEKWAGRAEIKQRVTDTNPTIRADAIELLVDRREPDAIEAALSALYDPDTQVRTRALDAALNASLEIPQHILLNLAQYDTSSMIRMMALNALAGHQTVPDPNLRSLAQLALNDPSPEVKEQARQILDQLDRPADVAEQSAGDELSVDAMQRAFESPAISPENPHQEESTHDITYIN